MEVNAPLRSCLPLVYANTTEKSPLRRIIIDRIVYTKDINNWLTKERADDAQLLDREMMLDKDLLLLLKHARLNTMRTIYAGFIAMERTPAIEEKL